VGAGGFTGGFDGYYCVHLFDVKRCGLKETIMPIQGNMRRREATRCLIEIPRGPNPGCIYSEDQTNFQERPYTEAKSLAISQPSRNCEIL
jgi:hypothetical protein